MENNGRFSDGFLMGVLVGGAAVFLLGTEKGNRVLKVMLEEGRAGLNDIMEEIEEYQEQAEEEDLEAAEDAQEAEIIEEAPKTNGNNGNGHAKSSSKKRFFRKVK